MKKSAINMSMKTFLKSTCESTQKHSQIDLNPLSFSALRGLAFAWLICFSWLPSPLQAQSLETASVENLKPDDLKEKLEEEEKEEQPDPAETFHQLMTDIKQRVFVQVCNLSEMQKSLKDWDADENHGAVMAAMAQKYAPDLWAKFGQTQARADEFIDSYNDDYKKTHTEAEENSIKSAIEIPEEDPEQSYKISSVDFMRLLQNKMLETNQGYGSAMLVDVMEECRKTLAEKFRDEVLSITHFAFANSVGANQSNSNPEDLFAPEPCKNGCEPKSSAQADTNDLMAGFIRGAIKTWKKFHNIKMIPSLALYTQAKWVYDFHGIGMQGVADNAAKVVDLSLFRCRSGVECDRSMTSLRLLVERAPKVLLKELPGTGKNLQGPLKNTLRAQWAKDLQSINHPTERRKWSYLLSSLLLEAEFYQKIKFRNWREKGRFIGLTKKWASQFRTRAKSLREDPNQHPFLHAPQVQSALEFGQELEEAVWKFAYINADSKEFNDQGVLDWDYIKAQAYFQRYSDEQRLGLDQRLRGWNNEVLASSESLRAVELYSERLEHRSSKAFIEKQWKRLNTAPQEAENGFNPVWIILSDRFSEREHYLAWGHLWNEFNLHLWKLVVEKGPSNHSRYLFRKGISDKEVAKKIPRLVSEKYSSQTAIEKLLVAQLLAYDPNQVSKRENQQHEIGNEPGIRGLKRNLIYASLHPVPGLQDGIGWFQIAGEDFKKKNMTTEDKEAWLAEHVPGFDSYIHLYQKSIQIDGKLQGAVEDFESSKTDQKLSEKKNKKINEIYMQHVRSILDLACLSVQFLPHVKRRYRMGMGHWKAHLNSLAPRLKTLTLGEGDLKIELDLGEFCGPGLAPPAGWRDQVFLRFSIQRNNWETSKTNAIQATHVLHSFWVSKATEPFVHAASRFTLASVLGLRTTYGISSKYVMAENARRIHSRYRAAKFASDIAGVSVGSIAFAEIHYHSLRLALGQKHERELGKEYLMGAAIFWGMARVQNLFLRGAQVLRGSFRMGRNSKIHYTKLKMNMRRFSRMDQLKKFNGFGETLYYVSARVLADTALFGTLPYIERAAGKAWGYTSFQYGKMMLPEGGKPSSFDYGDPIFQGDHWQNLMSGFETGGGFYVFGKFSQRAFMPKQKMNMMRQYTQLRRAERVVRKKLERDLQTDFLSHPQGKNIKKWTETEILELWQTQLDKGSVDTGIRTPNGLNRQKTFADLGALVGAKAKKMESLAGFLTVTPEHYKQILELQKEWQSTPELSRSLKGLVNKSARFAELPLPQKFIYQHYRILKNSLKEQAEGSNAKGANAEPVSEADIVVALRDIAQEARTLLLPENRKTLETEALDAAEDIVQIYDKIIEVRLLILIDLKRANVDTKTRELQKALRRIKDEMESYGYGSKKKYKFRPPTL